MRKALIFVVIAFLAITACKKDKTPQDEINEFIQKYLYSIRDAVDKKDGSIEKIYNTMLSAEMKKVFTLEDYKEYVTTRYKGKIGRELRTAYAQIVKDKATGNIMEATGQTSNTGRMGSVMNQDESLKFTVRLILENGKYKVEQQDKMAELEEEKEKKERLDELLKEYQGLITLENVTATKLPKLGEGWVKIKGTILNASEDLDMVKVGVLVKFKDSNGDIIYGEKFYPVIDMRYEGLRTSLLPGNAKVFETKIKDIPTEWDPAQPIEYEFYLIDGNKIGKEELRKELTDRAKLRRIIADQKKADEEARKQLKELWEKEKALKEKIKALKNKKK